MKGYSYIRWSSAKQGLGDSLRRQAELAEKYAEEHGIELDNSTYQDHGISAFTGKNLVEGKLGAFLQAIDDGRIETPCYLLVEALDRITRAEVDAALELFLSIIRRGVSIVTLQRQEVFSSESIKKDRGIGLIIAISMFIQGHEDSAKRGERVAEKWAKKRELQSQGVISTKHGPAWLKLVDLHPSEITNPLIKTKWELVEEKAEVMRRMYRLALSGWGSQRIARSFNEDGVPRLVRAKYWTHGNVAVLLRQPAVYGLYKQTRGDLQIEGYYPAIISKEDFDAVQAGRQGRIRKGGKTQNANNLFSGMAFCAYCGSRIRFQASGPRKGRINYMRCLRSLTKGGCDNLSVPYKAIEVGVLHQLINVQAREMALIFKFDEKPVAALEERVVNATAQIERLVDMSLRAPSVDAIVKRLEQAQADLDDAKQALEALRSGPLTQKEVLEKRELFNRIIDGGDEALRKEAQVALRRQVTRIDLAPYYQDMVGFDISPMVDGRGKWPSSVLHAVKVTFHGGATQWVKVTQTAGTPLSGS